MVKDSFVATYRVRLFELLGESVANEYVVFHGAPPSGSAHRAAEGSFRFRDVAVPNRELRLPGGSLIWQPLVSRILDGGFDAAVLGAEMRLLANVAVFVRLKRRGVPVLLWGQGVEKDAEAGALSGVVKRASESIKRRAARLADGYLVYTANGKQALVDAGVEADRVFVLGNTIDVEAEAQLRRSLDRADEVGLRDELGLSAEAAVLLFVGRVYPEKRADELIRAVSAVRSARRVERPVDAVVIGDGPALPEVRRAAEGLPGVHLLGEIRDPLLVAKYMRVSSALVIPGKVGLAVNHAFAHGLPVITRAGGWHAPEVEYLVDGDNGVIVDSSSGSLVGAIERIVEDDEWRDRLSAGALRASAGLGLEAMAIRFDGGVTATLARTP